MADKFAGITLGVDVSQVDRAVKSLKEFEHSTESAVDAVESFVNETEVAKQKQKEHASALAQGRKEYAAIASAIDPTVGKMKLLRESASKLDELWQKGVVPDKEFFRLSSVLESQENALRKNQKALTEEGRAALEESRQKEAAAKAGAAFIASLKQQSEAAGKTASELLEMKAAQLGVSEQAAPFIAQLNNQAKGLKLAGLSAGQYSNAMKILPMQITDVVTSLASGMPVWLVAIQQGGQIKDSFGGIGNTFKVLLSFLNPVRVGVGLLAAGLGALAVSVYSSRKELAELKKSIQENTNVGSDYAERLALNVRKIAEASKQTSEETLKAFISTKDGASIAMEKLLDVGVSYDEAKAKVEQYKKSGNFTALNADIEAHMLRVNGISSAWTEAAEKERDYWTGASQGKQDVALGGAVDNVVKVLERAKVLQKDMRQNTIDGNKEVAKTAELIKQQYLASNQVAGAENALTEARKLAAKVAASSDKEAIENSKKLVAQREQELKQAKEQEKKRNTPKKEKATPIVKGATEQLDKELYVLEAQLVTLKKHTQINDTISQQRKSLWAIEGQIQVLEEAGAKRKLTAQEQALLVSQKEVLASAQKKADLGDEIVKQERLNSLNDKSVKFIMDMNTQTETLNKTREMGVLAAQREAELAQITADWLKSGGNEGDAGLNSMLEKQRKYYADEDEKRADWLAGAKSAFATYGEEATNMYDNVGQVATAALDGMASTMTDFLMTGKASFADFAKSIISMIIKMIMQMVIFNSLAGAFGMGSSQWTLGSFMKGFSGGGYTGGGGKYEPKGVVHGGEFVFTKEATSRIGVGNLNRIMRGYANGGAVGGSSGQGLRLSSSGGSGTFVDVSGMKVDVNNGNDPKGLESGVRAIFNDMINEACSQGGRVFNYVNEKTGG